jgi:hypothetical protein
MPKPPVVGENAKYVDSEGNHDCASVCDVADDGTVTLRIWATGEHRSGLKHRSQLRGHHCDDECWIRADEH